MLKLCEDWIENLSLAITIFHHSASPVMPIGDPWDGFCYLTLSLMMDYYSILLVRAKQTELYGHP